MTDAREIIARHLCAMAAQGWSGISAFERAAYRTTAAGMVEAVTASGFRILGPDEVDGPTVEKCAEVAAAFDGRTDILKISGLGVATAIRALKEKRT